MTTTTTLNLNVGVLGHVDCGKTSLCKALSEIQSTACFDKNPQSQQRGITLDLGFSSFKHPLPENSAGYDEAQVTLVDCPGHASLIRTVIGGAQILDIMMLVIDITKGIQTQTAECLIVGEITCDKLLVVLNKIDLIPEEKRTAHFEKMKVGINKTLSKTKFKNAEVMFSCAGVEGKGQINVPELMNKLIDIVGIPDRNDNGPLLFAVDHCFSIKGQGTVLTGTMLSGSISINDMVEIPALKLQRKVKSIQKFKKPAQKIKQGDRAGICLTHFDAKLMERGYLCNEGGLNPVYGFICSVKKIRFHKTPIKSGQKFHVSIGHETVMAKVDFFGLTSKSDFSFDHEYEFVEELGGRIENSKYGVQYALLKFETPVICPENAIYIASRLETELGSKTCRLCFHGRSINPFYSQQYQINNLQQLKVYKTKLKTGVVERANDNRNLIAKGMFKKETNMSLFSGLKIALSTGQTGIIEGAFGKSGKFKVKLDSALSDEDTESLQKKKGENANLEKKEQINVTLEFKKYIYDSDKKWKQ